MMRTYNFNEIIQHGSGYHAAGFIYEENYPARDAEGDPIPGNFVRELWPDGATGTVPAEGYPFDGWRHTDDCECFDCLAEAAKND